MSEPGAIRRLPRPGTIVPFGGDTIPSGWLLCNGAAVSRTGYARLYSAIGTAWGAGDGSTTFNLPDGRGRVLQGVDSTNSLGDSVGASAPDIYGSTYVMRWRNTGSASLSVGAFKRSTETTYMNQDSSEGSSMGGNPIYFYASDYDSTYSEGATVQSPAVCTQYIVRC